MAYGYSIDLRERVLQAIDAGMSRMTAHRTFHVSRPTIDRWLALRAQTGSLTPRRPRHTRVRQLEGAAFEAFAVRHAHATLAEMAAAWQQETGVLLLRSSGIPSKHEYALTGYTAWTSNKPLRRLSCNECEIKCYM